MKKKKVCKICIIVVAVVVALIMLFLGTRFVYIMMLRNNPAKYLKYEEKSDGTLAVTGFKCEWLYFVKEFDVNRTLVIPKEVEGKAVTELGDRFTRCVWITNIEIPNSITTIGHYAFAGITDSELRIPNSVTSIGEGLLLNENIIRVWIPNSVTNIDAPVASHWHAEEVTIFTTQGSYAEEWAKSYELHVEYCDEEAYLNNYEGATEVADKGIEFLEAKVGDIVYFGHYEQDNDVSNGKEEIAWRVLEAEELPHVPYKKMYLLSEYILDVQQFHTNNDVSMWGNNSLRTWLNDTFLYSAFTTEENAMISTYHPSGSTDEKIALLTEEQLKRYFANGDECRAEATLYAQSLANAVGTYSNHWWLADGGKYDNIKLVFGGKVISADGLYNVVSDYPAKGYYGVRPSIVIMVETE